MLLRSFKIPGKRRLPDGASHPVGHSADAANDKAGKYSFNRSRWPFEQAGMFVATRTELADRRRAIPCALEVLIGLYQRPTGHVEHRAFQMSAHPPHSARRLSIFTINWQAARAFATCATLRSLSYFWAYTRTCMTPSPLLGTKILVVFESYPMVFAPSFVAISCTSEYLSGES